MEEYLELRIAYYKKQLDREKDGDDACKKYMRGKMEAFEEILTLCETCTHKQNLPYGKMCYGCIVNRKTQSQYAFNFMPNPNFKEVMTPEDYDQFIKNIQGLTFDPESLHDEPKEVNENEIKNRR